MHRPISALCRREKTCSLPVNYLQKARIAQRLLLLFALPFLLLQTALAQNYTYTTEGFEQTGIWPTANSSTAKKVAANTGTWEVKNASRNTSTFAPGGAASLATSSSGYFISPYLPKGAAVLSWKSSSSSSSGRPYIVSTSIDGVTFTQLTTGTGNGNGASAAWKVETINVNKPLIRYIKVQTNGGGTAYYDDVNITEPIINAPTLSTTAASAITYSTASSGGNISNDGGAAVTERGLVWSTSPSPTVNSNLGKTVNGIGTGAFASLLTGLQPSTKYYYRSYAINSQGTAYGAELSFTTLPPSPTLTVSASSLSFGNQQVNTVSTALNYTLSGIYLSPSVGNITITAPAGFTLSTTSNGSYASTLTLPYTGSALPATTIYIRFAPTTTGAYSADLINAGGGTTTKVALTAAGNAALSDVTNVGLDFWTGFGYIERMSEKAGTAGEASLSVYLSVPAGTLPAQVVVEMPGIPGAAGFPKTVTVTPGVVSEVKGFPTGDPANAYNPNGKPDSRLYYTGVSNRGIHIYSTNGVPISAWIYTYSTFHSAAGAMLFPTNTWSSSYTVQAYGGQSNTPNPNSFFFVVAKEDNTPIWFKPSQDVLDSITGPSGTIFTDNHNAAQVKYKKGVEYGPIYLKKGQVFNAMGFIRGNGTGLGATKAFGLDLSGSTVRTSCDKQIAVFGGNGRCFINAAACSSSTGSDNMIQQMFPDVAWGRTYLTVPTKTMEYNLYRVNVMDPATKVWVNNPAHTSPLGGLVNNVYYEFASKDPQLIESDKPVSVTQFIVSGECAEQFGSKGLGDPEMIILSPVEQAINSTTVYSATIKNPDATTTGHYLNVIIKKEGVASFRLDGSANGDPGIDQSLAVTNSSAKPPTTTAYNTGGSKPLTDIFKPHPQNPAYYFASLRVLSGKSHTLSSDSAFTAIAYGMADGESYGYNAGTNLKDLSQSLLIQNPYAQTTGLACKSNPFYFKIAIPYEPAQLSNLTWDFSGSPVLSPNATVIQNNPVADSAYVTEGTTYYVYKIPTAYNFSQIGAYPFKVSASLINASGCSGAKLFNKVITVVNGPVADFDPQIGTCGNLAVSFTNKSSSDSTSLVSYAWNFGDAGSNPATSAAASPDFTFSAANSYNVTLRAINAAGCYADVSKTIDVSGSLKNSFTVTPSATVCSGTALTFSTGAASSGTYGNITNWQWDFGDGTSVNATTDADQQHTFSTAGQYTVKLIVKTSNNCTSDAFTLPVTVAATPSITSAATGTVCTGDEQAYNITSNLAGTTYTWSRDAVNGISNAEVSNQTTAIITESLVNTTTAPVDVTYVITPSSTGCPVTPFNYVVTVNPKPTVDFSFTNSGCAKDAVNFTSMVTGAVTTYAWNFGANNQTSSQQNPSFTYNNGGTYNVQLTVTATGNCTASVTKPVTVAGTLPDPVISVDSTINSVAFSWQPVAGATGYQISVDGGSFITPNGTNGLSHTVTGLQPNQTVSVIVRALGTLDCQVSSKGATGKTILPSLDVFVPNTFSPNGDGRNDVLKVYANNIQSLRMEIFNQWGQLIFTSTDAGRGWDGVYNGKPQPVGVYAYVVSVTLQGGKTITRKGLFNLIR